MRRGTRSKEDWLQNISGYLSARSPETDADRRERTVKTCGRRMTRINTFIHGAKGVGAITETHIRIGMAECKPGEPADVGAALLRWWAMGLRGDRRTWDTGRYDNKREARTARS